MTKDSLFILSGKIDVVLVHDQVVVEGEGAGLPLDPGLRSADASLHPDPGNYRF